MAIAPTINFNVITNGIKSIDSGLNKLKKSADNIKIISLNKTKIKRESIVKNRMLSSIREESDKRKEQESIIEASGIGGAFKRTSKIITDSTKGFLERILDFASTLLLGWLLYNLPTILTAIENLIDRIKSLYKILTEFISTIGDTLQNFGQLLYAVYQDIISFDFTDQSKRVQNAMDDLNTNIDSMYNEFMKGFDLLKTPLGQGPEEEAIPGFNTDYTTEPGPTTGGGQDLYTLATIANLESGSAQGQADVAQSIYNRMKKSGQGVVDVVTSPSQYEPFFGKSSKDIDPAAKNIKTFDDAVNYRMKKTGENRKTAERSILSTISAIQDPSKQAAARQLVGTRTSFRGSPQNTGNTLGNVTWRGGRTENQFLNEEVVSGTPGTVPSFVNSPTNLSQQTGQSATSTPIKGKTAGYSQAVSFGKSLLAKGYKNIWQHPDFEWSSGYTGSGKERVARRDYDSAHHYGEALDISAFNGEGKLDALYAVLNKNRSKYGIKDLLWRVKGHYDHLHISFNKMGSTLISSTSSQQPQQSQTRESISTKSQPQPQRQPSQIQIQITPTTQPGQNVPPIAQEKKGQQIMFIDDRQPSAPQQVYTDNTQSYQIYSSEDSLNSLIKNQILLELAYT